MAETQSTTAKEAGFQAKLAKEIKLPTAVLALDATSDGHHLFGACFDGGVYQVEAESGKHEKLIQHDSYASGVWLLKRSQTLISAGYDGKLTWFDLRQRKAIRTVAAHRFWSWQLAASADEQLIASVTGQYLAGGYKYEPAAEQEPCVRIFEAESGALRHSFSHIPPVLSVVFSPDNRYVAAANMMGEIRIWDVQSGQQVAAWSTPSFTSWGIIKSHHYVGGIFALVFTPDSNELLVCGMGSMTDPMAGNGKQLWERFAWRETPPRKASEIIEGERGNGLMETIWFHPAQQQFAMAGRLAQGKWNTALFDATSGKLIHSFDSKMRVTDVAFNQTGDRLFLGGAVSQEKKKDGKYPEFGRIKIYNYTAEG